MMTIIKPLIMSTAITKQYNLYNVSTVGDFAYFIEEKKRIMTEIIV